MKKYVKNVKEYGLRTYKNSSFNYSLLARCHCGKYEGICRKYERNMKEFEGNMKEYDMKQDLFCLAWLENLVNMSSRLLKVPPSKCRCNTSL